MFEKSLYVFPQRFVAMSLIGFLVIRCSFIIMRMSPRAFWRYVFFRWGFMGF